MIAISDQVGASAANSIVPRLARKRFDCAGRASVAYFAQNGRDAT
jgi:hypothetical protein